MPAVVDDPASPTIYRVSGQPPFPDPGAALPDSIVPRRVTLRDRQTVATILPIVSVERQVPESLINYLCGQINREIEGGDTYPMMEPFTPAGFAAHWFQNFGAVMLLGDFGGDESGGGGGTAIPDSHDWARDCLGSFYIKPNYPGRSSHVCNGGLLVTDASRNRGVGRLMGESYIDWAPRLGYTYSVFNLVYETNVASCRIWDALGFKRIGRVKGCGNLRSHPDRLVDAIIYGRDLPPPRDDGDEGGGGEDGALVVSEERFDKIRYYLKFGRYPEGADRAEKSRLRSAATHYKLLDDGDTLMLKDKLVVSDPARQYDIARATHSVHHGGINKTTAVIAEKYHWSRIKETVSDVIRLCKECKELAKAPGSSNNNNSNNNAATNGGRVAATSKPTTPVAGVKRSRSPSPDATDTGSTSTAAAAAAVALARSQSGPPRHPSASSSLTVDHHERVLGLRAHHANSTLLLPEAVNPLLHHDHHPHLGPYANPSDISVVRPSQTTLLHGGGDGATAAAGFLHSHHQHEDDVDANYQPIDPRIMNHHHQHDDQDHAHEDGIHHAFDGYHPHADFQALLHATEDDGGAAAAAAAAESERRAAAVDRDLEMLIAHGAEDEDEDVVGVGVGVVLEKLEKDGGGTDGDAGEEGAAAPGVGHADEDMNDLDDSLLRDTRGWG
ncbi:histone acetyltransferase Spt10 [Cordyceps fumosorosea ARSEF 2679]|uniref:Histone acetyltransferase Spt10 n=1 Tax=Cordyceps fumosorosea (strain ARSEF 2679) TaxID=1081104 RepID=A0A167NX66_CORFA|nr:histone acetyltransferase Spt10 [Cordyceps fumosorosea ARSEF 2679]OAA56047.1 histone acetyltransferase Spt10 [Cordyceps fumosorosea ARSEF 2679]